jgi:hypothetical protein
MKACKLPFVIRIATAFLFATLALVAVPATHAATPASGSIGSGVTKLTYTGTTTTVNPATFDPTTCQTAGYCDVYTLTVKVSNSYRAAYPNFRVNLQFAWSGNTNEFDMYDYFGGNAVATSANSFVTTQMTRLEHPANGTYTIYASFSLGVPGTSYTSTVTLQNSPVSNEKPAASYTLDPDGKFGPQMFQFTDDMLLVATPPTGTPGADIEPGIVIDQFGNIYTSAIEGVPAGSDFWRSTDFGNTFTYLGQPDDSAGGGDEDLSMGFPFVGDQVYGDSTGRVYYSSLNLADIDLQTSANKGATFFPGDSPAKVVDRMWLAGAGTSRDYMITVQLGADLNGTDSLIVTQSDDGGITYTKGALVSQAILDGTPETGFHSNIVAYPGVLGGATPNSSIYTTFTSADAVDLYVAACPAPCDLPLLPTAGLPGKQSFTSVLAFSAPPGTTLGNVFTPIAVGDDGSLYVAFSTQQLDKSGNQTGENVYVIWSRDTGKTWSKAIQVNNPGDPGTASAMLPWITAGAKGLIGLHWYGTDVVGDPNNQTIFANAKWKMYYALVNTIGKPTVQYVVASGTRNGTADQLAGVVHYGSICTQGTDCDIAVPAGNRELAEYAELTNDLFGSAHLTISEDNVSSGSAYAWYTKQTAGPSLRPNVGAGAGYFNISSGTGNFGLVVGKSNVTGTKLRQGHLIYLDNSANILLSDIGGFTKVSIDATSIHVSGTGTLQSGSTVSFTATATGGGPGAGKFTISWPGYSGSGTLVEGQITK